MKDISISHILIEPIPKILPLEIPKITKKWPNRQNSGIRVPPDPHGGKSSKSALLVCAKLKYLSFKTGHDKKYGVFEKNIFGKKKLGVSGIPQNRKGVKIFWFQKSLGIILMVILSP